MTEHLEELFPFYALGVLSAEETAEIEAYAAINPAAQAQLTEACQTAAALSYGVKPVMPSAQVKTAVLNRINAEVRRSALRPVAPPVAAPGFFERLWRSLQGGAALPALAGLSLLVALFAGGWAILLNSQMAQLRQQNLALGQQITQQNETLTALSEQLTPLLAENRQLKSDLAVQSETLAALNEAVTPLQTENIGLKQELAAQAEQLAALQSQVTAQPQPKNTVSAETMAALEAELTAQREQLAALNGQVAQIQAVNNNLGQELSTQRAVMAEVTSPDVQAMKISGTEIIPQAHGQLIANPGDEKAVLIVSGLRPLEPGLIYQFWLVQDGQLRRAGEFTVDESGLGLLQVTTETPIGAYDAMGISIEPANSADQPPNEMIMLGNFSS
jgi:uncharacterized coiled-coil protein SlyX